MKKSKKLLAFGCSAALIVSSFCGCSSADDTADSNAEEVAVIQDALEELDGVSDLISHSDTAGKNETVYAILDGNGQVQQTIVSEWLKNPEGSTSVKDKTDLSDITVVKGNAEYTKDGSEDQIRWETDGSDIYYQGNSNKELPVDVHITYELDGTAVDADALSGASGHLKMTFQYTNNVSKTVKINGKNKRIYQPFVMISGMLLDNSKAKNITVENGTAVNSGDDTLVFGLAMPGLKDSMGLSDAIDLDIPETVTVEADVTDFSLMMTLTLASNNALSQLGLEDIDTVDDLKADMEELTNGMSDIVEGASQLDDGSQELKDGLDALNSKAPDLSKGVSAMADGVKDLSDGVNTLTGKNEELKNGASKLANGLSELNDSLNNKESEQQLEALVSGSTGISQGISDLSGSLAKITAGYDYTSGDLSNLIAGLEQYAQGLENSQDPAGAVYAGYIRTLIETYQGLYANVAGVQSGVSDLSDYYRSVDTGISTLAGSMNQIGDAVGQLTEGAVQLKSGVDAYTDGVASASAGVKELKSGLNSLNGQIPALVKGIGQLSDGAVSLAAGTLELKDGVLRFDEEGIQKLADVIGNDLEGYFDRLKAIQEYAEEYTSFAGCSEGTECSVKFIYKTAGI